MFVKDSLNRVRQARHLLVRVVETVENLLEQQGEAFFGVREIRTEFVDLTLQSLLLIRRFS